MSGIVLLVKVRAMRHSLFARFLLIFALLFAQLGGLTHGISHTLADQSQDQSLPHDKHCDLCAAYAQLGSAIGSNTLHFSPVDSQETRLHPLFTASTSVSFSAFSARAPPYSA
ncbi:MAG: hypothetical protein Q7U37_03515 [Gallionella sp.]|nr:hypothetical protein [Gallionella sp.]MDP1594803.1 hypothetical protein [Gallionella sp.]MDP1939524.1 hypothetical protein [Gallionella sp.]